VRPHTVFLRRGCILPNQLDPLQEEVGSDWMQVEDLDAPVFDTIIRQAGWHFMWIQSSSARKGFGITQENAVDRALIHALDGVAQRFNAAELDSVQVTEYLGFHVATVIVQSRQIQQQTSLDCPNDI